MTRMLVLAFAALALAGCVNLDPYSQPVVVEAGPAPTTAQVQPLILAWLLPQLKDPDSLKAFEITRIVKTRYFIGAPIAHKGTAEGWLACFQYNAKNSYGAYPGVSTYGLVFKVRSNGQVGFQMTQDGAIMSPRCS